MIIFSYHHLKKPYFVVTSNTDDHFAMDGFDRKAIFEIEGNMKDMQCAKGCHNKIYPNREAVLAMRKHEQGMIIPSQYLPKCPVCGGPMQLHVPVTQAFVKDQEWQARCQDYQSFLERLHGKKLLILEFGVGIRNQMIKAPFMKLAYAERNAFYITFNKGEIHIPHQIQDKAIGVDGDLVLILPKIPDNFKKI